MGALMTRVFGSGTSFSAPGVLVARLALCFVSSGRSWMLQVPPWRGSVGGICTAAFLGLGPVAQPAIQPGQPYSPLQGNICFNGLFGVSGYEASDTFMVDLLSIAAISASSDMVHWPFGLMVVRVFGPFVCPLALEALHLSSRPPRATTNHHTSNSPASENTAPPAETRLLPRFHPSSA